MKKKLYNLKSKVVLWKGAQAAWHFAGVNQKCSAEIKANFGKLAGGFGSIPVEVTIGETTWQTSIFWDARGKSYILPLKAAVRKAEAVMAGEEIKYKLRIR